MASIKERAAALNLAEKLCVRPLASGVAVKPVQSTLLWSSLISHLRSNVTVKRRRVHIKSHSDCFLGSEAVDVVAEHINQIKGLEDADVTRDKVVCVCQALLDCSVFEAVGTKVFGKDKKQVVFQDSKSALYRFVGRHTPSVDELERGELMDGIQKLFFSGPANRGQENTFPPRFHVQMSTPVRLTQTTVKFNRLNTPTADSSSLEPPVDGPSPSPSASLSPSSSRLHSPVPQSLVDEVWQEQTLLHLLKLVELPLLDGVLQCSQKTPSPCKTHTLVHNNPDLIYSSNHLDRQILKAFRDSQEDEWLCAALDCLDFLPDQPVVELSRGLPHCFPEAPGSCSQGAAVDQCKQLLYETLVKHYSHSDQPPLLPQHMTDVYTAITDLLVNAKLATALEALQLCLKLLRPGCREELRRLLTFMALAAEPQGIKLDKEVENRIAVKKSFSKAILHSKGLSKEKEDLMVVFMLSNIQEIFKIPGALHKEVSDKLASLVQGKQPDVTGPTLCQQVSSRTYSASTKTNTNQELWTLLDSIHSDSKLSSKQRKHLLEQFYQAHPEVFNQYFGDSAVSVL
ncbi:DEP domain-containing protein 7-like [Sphaeramia orbicularis]|uniref:DEP domain-containing protein 7-like n=1 Tax=Sphaeramia orbicularis TaxID=375764 RepID=UPI00117CB2F8|nr:DEP domain-containing protein 7-like [Sphaeramia orbicularis]